MGLPTASDVCDAVRVRWAAVPALQVLVPAARVYAGRAAERTPWPYAVLKAESAAAEPTTGYHLTRWAITVEAYCAADPPDAPAVEAAISAAFTGTSAAPAAGLSVAGAGVETVACKRAPGWSARPTGERREGSDAVRVTARFELLVSATP